MTRLVFYALAVALGVWMAFAIRSLDGERAAAIDEPTTTDPATVEVDRKLQGRNVEQWHSIAARYLQRSRSLTRAIRYDPETTTAIGLACVVYGHCSELWRKAQCESHLYRYARNRSSDASGLFQFLPSTWRSTPFGRYSIFDPYASALAAGWMHSRGRGGEWVCR
ncbi:MAG TPA: hypothetical protein VH482_37955 [Thermomicrobiales bacterium]|jgi:hypothetical protein